MGSPISEQKMLIIGATGYIGRFIVEASVKLGHPTFAFVRPLDTFASPQNTEKAKLIQSFKNDGVHVLFGDLNEHDVLVDAIRKVDVVFSVVGHDPSKQLEDQVHIISAIKEAGNTKRFFPSEFGFDVDRLQILEPAKSILAIKTRLRDIIRKESIPFTFVSCNFFATYFPSRLGQVEATSLPQDEVFILGDGNTKAVFTDEHDIATYAIKAASDERTLNKILYIRPRANIYSINELVSLYEKKTNKILERTYIPEEVILKKIKESSSPLAFYYSIAHAGFISGETTNFDIDPSLGVEASLLYPDVKYTTLEERMDKLILQDK